MAGGSTTIAGSDDGDDAGHLADAHAQLAGCENVDVQMYVHMICTCIVLYGHLTDVQAQLAGIGGGMPPPRP